MSDEIRQSMPYLEADWSAAELTQRVEGDAIRYRISVPIYQAGVVLKKPTP